jgi:ribosome-associated heat shock protein Hsp15
MAAGAETLHPSMRIDKWLVYARFCKTRSQSAALVAGGLRINGRKIEKPDAKLHVGDVLTFAAGVQIHVVEVLQLAERRHAPLPAQTLYKILPQSTAGLE